VGVLEQELLPQILLLGGGLLVVVDLQVLVFMELVILEEFLPEGVILLEEEVLEVLEVIRDLLALD
jgi:hypothetical protein